MREIKFRAWDGERLYRPTSVDHPHANLITDTPYPSLYYLPMSYLVGDSNDWIWMQYTGLKDKNGKEIYEGDIIRLGLNDDLLHTVYYDESSAVYDIKTNYGQCHYSLAELARDNEIIGNIYENSELME